MSIQPYTSKNQTSLVPNSLLGYSSNGVSAIEILPTSITIAGDLTTTPIYVGISATSGLTTTNPTGLDVNCDFNMNNNDITTLETISFNNTTTTNTYTIGVNTNDLKISSGGDRLLLDSGNNEFYLGEFFTGTAPSISSTGSSTKTIFINSRDGISQIGDTDNTFNQTKIIVNDSSSTINLTASNGNINTNSTGIQMNASDFVNITAGNDAMLLQAGDDITLTSLEKGILIEGGSGDAGVNDITLTTQNSTLVGNINLNSAGDLIFQSSSSTNIACPLGVYFNNTNALNIGNGTLYCNDITNVLNITGTTDANLVLQTIGDADINLNTDKVVLITAPTNQLQITDGTTTNIINQLGYTTRNTTANLTHYLNFSDSSSTGIGSIQKTAGISCNPNTNTITATTFVGSLTGSCSTTGLVFLQTLTGTITGSATATTFTLPSIFSTTYKNYKIQFTFGQNSFTAYPSVSLNGYSGTNVPTTADLYGYDMTSGVLSAVNLANQTLSTNPLQLTGACLPNCHLEFDIFNVGYTTLQSNNIIRIVCNSTYNNPGVKGIRNITATTTQNSSSTITGLSLQSIMGVGNNPTWTAKIYGYK